MKISYLKMFVIWFTLSVIMTYLIFATAILPGVNIPGMPVVIVMTLLVHLSMFLWIMWTYIESPDPSKPNAQSFEEIKKENEKAWLINGIERNKF